MIKPALFLFKHKILIKKKKKTFVQMIIIIMLWIEEDIIFKNNDDDKEGYDPMNDLPYEYGRNHIQKMNTNFCEKLFFIWQI